MSKNESIPFISIITVNYRQAALTLEFLESISKIDYPNFEVVVIDNDVQASELQDKIPTLSYNFSIRYFHTHKNLGFAGGNNVGIKESKGEYLFFINNDTEVPADILTTLLGVFKTYPNAGMVSPKLIFDESGLIQYAGAIKINPYTGRGRKIGNGETDFNQYDQINETELGHGAAMMIPKSVIDKVGLMPEIYFLYYEEHDWGEQIKRAGYKILYCGKTYVRHKESMTIGKKSLIKTYYMTRNRLLYIRRNTTGLTKLFALLFFSIIALPKTIFILSLKREWNHLNEVFKAINWNLTNSST